MKISPEARFRIQIVLAIAIVTAAIRAGYVFYERHSGPAAEQKTEKPLNPDYYVTPKKLHPYDLKSARELTTMPVWVKEGYRYTFYPYDKSSKRTDFGHEAGLLLPIEKVQIEDVVLNNTPGVPGQKQVMAVFEKEGKGYAVPIGTEKGGDMRIYSDEMFYIQDPHELYRHWPADTWKAIEQHEVKPGMNEMQAVFALGMGIPEAQSDPSVKTVKYPNGGKPVTITYRDGKALKIENPDKNLGSLEKSETPQQGLTS
jgi:hypothetical protein